MIWYSTHNLNIVHNISWKEFDKSTLSKLTVKLHQEEMEKAIGIIWPRSSKINTAIKCKVIATIDVTTLVYLCHRFLVLCRHAVIFICKTLRYSFSSCKYLLICQIVVLFCISSLNSSASKCFWRSKFNESKLLLFFSYILTSDRINFQQRF